MTLDKLNDKKKETKK